MLLWVGRNSLKFFGLAALGLAVARIAVLQLSYLLFFGSAQV
jgi:hypothetical protein